MKSRWLRRIAKSLAILVAILLLPVLYVHVWCHGWGVSEKPETKVEEVAIPSELEASLQNIEARVRKGSSTLLTFPEWYIVFTSQDYARYIAAHSPSGFSYFNSAFGFWGCYCDANRYASARYPHDWDMHIVNYVIGVSHTVEFVIKGIYENTIGRLTELFAPEKTTEEEEFARRFFADYSQSLNTVPWFEYDFSKRQSELWSAVPTSGDGWLRKWERRLALSAELAVKSAYGAMIAGGTRATFTADVPKTVTVMKDMPAELIEQNSDITEIARSGAFSVVKFPRYAPFRDLLPKLYETQAVFLDIAGNRNILITAKVLGDNNKGLPDYFEEVFSTSLLSGENGMRAGFLVPVSSLLNALRYLKDQGHTLEHAYDY